MKARRSSRSGNQIEAMLSKHFGPSTRPSSKTGLTELDTVETTQTLCPQMSDPFGR